jgi:acyl-CoA hydrolase
MKRSNELLAHIPETDGTIVVAPATGCPNEALQIIHDNADAFTHLQILGMYSPKEWPACPNIQRVSTFFSEADRRCYWPPDGVTPSVETADVHFSGMFDYMFDQDPKLVVVNATPEREGLRSLGTGSDYTHPLIEAGVPVYVVEHADMPWVNGNQFSEERVVGVMPATDDLYRIPTPATSRDPEIDQLIADNVGQLVVDAADSRHRVRAPATLQIGVGYLPSLVLDGVSDKIDGIWSEVLTDAMANIRARMIPIVGTFALGTEVLWKFIDGNPNVSMLPAHVTNSAEEIRRRQIISVNQAMAVTLHGETVVGVGRRYSGAGGQRDFSANAPTAIIALHSTRAAEDGTLVSNILPFVGMNDHLMLSAMDRPTYVVTEYGTAKLRDKGGADTVRGVARQLIENCVHPDLRGEMWKAAKNIGYLPEGRAHEYSW